MIEQLVCDFIISQSFASFWNSLWINFWCNKAVVIKYQIWLSTNLFVYFFLKYLVFWSLTHVMKWAKLTKDNNRTPNDDAKMCEIGNGAQNIHNFVVIFAWRQDCNQLEDRGGTNNTPTQDEKCCCLKKRIIYFRGYRAIK